MKLLAGLTLAVLIAAPVSAAPQTATGSITINEPPPYHAFGTVTLTVTWSKLKGYEYPVVLIKCASTATGENVWTYFRRWDTDGPPDESGPEPVVLGGDPNNTSIRWNTVGGDADCSVELWAYGGLSHPAGEHLLASAPPIHVTRP